MQVRLEPRVHIPLWLSIASPIFALFLTLVISGLLFLALGYPPLEAMKVYFISPLETNYGIAELFVKAVPLLLCAIGLMFCFRAGIWNIGAEGQLVLGALVGSVIALKVSEDVGSWVLIVMLIMGMIGGALWAAIPALLKTRFGANEILSSLMLTYVAILLLNVMVHGPLRDPEGYNFPHSRVLQDGAILPIIWEGTRLHLGVILAFISVIIAYFIYARHELGFGVKLLGLAPRAAIYAGYSTKRLTWGVLLFSGALAGLAGIIEVAGPIERLTPTVSPGYGFTAIIVAFLGRLHPIGILFASFIIALSYLGGELAQILLKIPNAVTGVFQGILLFTLLGCDLLVNYKFRIVASLSTQKA